MQDIVDPFTDEMLARFVVDSHARSQPKGANLEDRVPTDVEDDPLAAARQADPDVRTLCTSHNRNIFLLNFIVFNKILYFLDPLSRHAEEVHNLCQVERVSQNS